MPPPGSNCLRKSHGAPFPPRRPLALPCRSCGFFFFFPPKLQAQSTSVGDVRFRLLSGRDIPDSDEAHRAMEEFKRSIRHRAADVAERSGARGGSASGAATAIAADTMAANALGVQPSGAYGVVRSRSLASSASAGGLAGEYPWFSLRPPQWNQQQSEVAVPSGQMGRQGFGRSSTSARRWEGCVCLCVSRHVSFLKGNRLCEYRMGGRGRCSVFRRLGLGELAFVCRRMAACSRR